MILFFLILLNFLVAFLSWFFQISFLDNLLIPVLVFPLLINLFLYLCLKSKISGHIFSLLIFYVSLVILFFNLDKFNIMGNSWI